MMVEVQTLFEEQGRDAMSSSTGTAIDALDTIDNTAKTMEGIADALEYRSRAERGDPMLSMLSDVVVSQVKSLRSASAILTVTVRKAGKRKHE